MPGKIPVVDDVVELVMFTQHHEVSVYTDRATADKAIRGWIDIKKSLMKGDMGVPSCLSFGKEFLGAAIETGSIIALVIRAAPEK